MDLGTAQAAKLTGLCSRAVLNAHKALSLK